MKNDNIFVNCEVGKLKRLMIHSPDSGIGKIIPAKAQDWLYEDIVDLERMREEYDVYKQILFAFLDMPSLKKWFEMEKTFFKREFHNPKNENFIKSEFVVEIQKYLGEILQEEEDKDTRESLVDSICAIERC